MEKVTDLFKAFRNKQIEYDELFGELTKMLSEDPHFSVQAIASLDSAQQQTPIPVTDFINLRAKLESTAETFHQQETSHGPADAESTLMFDAEDATAAPNDPTLIGNNGGIESVVSQVAPAATAPSSFSDEPPVAPASPPEEDYADEATVIMPMPPRQTAGAATQSQDLQSAPAEAKPAADSNMEETVIAPAISEDSNDAMSEDAHATLIAAPMADASVDNSAPAEETPMPTETTPDSVAENAEEAQPKAIPSKPPIALIAAGAAAAVVILVVIVMWSGGSDTPEEIAESPTMATESSEPSPWGEKLPEEAFDAEKSVGTVSTNANISDAEETLEQNQVANTDSDLQAMDSQPVEPEQITTSAETIEANQTGLSETETSTSTTTAEAPAVNASAEPEIKDEAYYVSAIQQAVDSNNLGPAENEGSATFYLVELIKLNQESLEISNARTLISKKHIQLSKESRSNNRWEEAQQHLDDALKVRLPDSYLPE
ncbi:MAG: hypothetical protein MI867_18975 [Pseudomonadales bacterium]|nr:hypothetical protein [Pseudomonadales bacterium]